MTPEPVFEPGSFRGAGERLTTRPLSCQNVSDLSIDTLSPIKVWVIQQFNLFFCHNSNSLLVFTKFAIITRKALFKKETCILELVNIVLDMQKKKKMN